MFRIKPLIALLVVILVVVAIFLSFASRYAQQSPQPAPPAAQTQPSQPSEKVPVTQKPRTHVSPPAQQTQQNKNVLILSPAASEKWVIGETNAIKWNKESGLPGQIYLVRASDKSVVGWINSETGPHQTSADWDGRDVAISRYNSQRKNVDHGNYVIKIKFDTKNIPEAVSDVFSLAYKSEIPVGNYTISIKGYVFSLSALNVKKGDTLTFVNNDSVTHQIALSSFSPFVIRPGESYDFDTSPLFPGPYNFYSDAYSSLKLKVTVQ